MLVFHVRDCVSQDRYKAQEAREYEARQLRLSLRERDHDIERANQMLMTTEETIDVSRSGDVAGSRRTGRV